MVSYSIEQCIEKDFVMKQEEYIKNRIEVQISWYDRRSQINQRWYKGLQLSQFILATSIPFLAGYISDGDNKVVFAIGLIGFLTAILVAILGLYKFQENWIKYRTTCEALKHEKYLFLTSSVPYEIESNFSLLVQRVENLISSENINWAQYMMSWREAPNES